MSSGATSVCFGCSDTVDGNPVFQLRNGAHSALFQACLKLTTITCSESCTMSSFPRSCFVNCSNVLSVTFGSSFTHPGWNAFAGCKYLNNLNFTGFGYLDAESFSGTTALTNINWGTTIRWIGSNCFSGSGLKLLPLDDTGNFISSLTSIQDTAFSNCVNLGYLEDGDHKTNLITLLKGSSITSIGRDAFGSCQYLTGAYDDNLANCKIIVDSDTGEITRKPGEGTKISLNDSFPNTDITKGKKFQLADSTKVGDGEFAGTTSIFDATTNAVITELTIPYTVTSIGASAFKGCTSITKITIENDSSNSKISQLSSIGERAFEGCSNLVSIVGDLPNLETIGNYAFDGLSKLTTIGTTSNLKTIGDYAFRSCIKLDAFDFDSVKEIGSYAFQKCSSLGIDVVFKSTSLVLHGVCFADGCAIKSVDFSRCITCSLLGNYHFSGATYLSNCILPPNITVIPLGFFGNCIVEDIELPLSVTTIREYAFTKCRNLTEISGFGGVQIVGSYAFENCSSLSMIDDLSSVNQFGDYSFTGCTSLTLNSFKNYSWNKITFGEAVFNGCTSLVGNITLTDCVAPPSTWTGCSANLKRTYVTTTY